MTATDQHPATVALSKQLEVATDINACFCIGCGQPDEPELHDPARCPAREGGKLDVLTVADALEVYDTSCDEEPDLDGDARALHCAIVATRLASVSSASAERRPDGRAVPGDARTINGDLHFYRAAGWYPAPTPEPVPATNQAGEVEPEAVVRVAKALCSLTGSESCSLSWGDWVSDAKYVLAALATQPATPQEIAWRGTDEEQYEARINACCSRRTEWPAQNCPRDGSCDDCWQDMAEALRVEPGPSAAFATQPATSQEGEDTLDAIMRNHCLRYGQGETLAPHEMADMLGWLMARAGLRAPGPIAATPAPPTLSEDLREAIEGVIEHVEVRIQDGKEIGSTVWRLALEDVARDLRASLTTSPARSYADGVAMACDQFEVAIGEGYPPPPDKTTQCAHGQFGWEDCITCYDEALIAKTAAIRLLSQGGKA